MDKRAWTGYNTAMPIAFFTAVSVQLVCQLTKFIAYSIRDKKFTPSYLATAGGMPSAHSAFVSSLTTYVALAEGTSGPWFSVSLVFALIVMYDAFRLRGYVQRHAESINIIREELSSQLKDKIPRHSEMVGHSLMEVASGGILGAGWAWLIWHLLPGV
ncbi:divergent PAP2 family protein [Salinispira pacifica]|nr:divergent PAP2 family protein [Salinispira pacifica]